MPGEKEPFDGLFGVFNDSLPDGWGRLLLDRTLSSRGINIQEITPLDRLAFVGSGGMGALVYQPDYAAATGSELQIELDEIARAMNHILQGTGSEIIEELFELGGSSGGARPKIFTAYHPGTGEILHGKKELPEGFEPWIIKFPSSSDNPEIAKIEYAYHLMAVRAGKLRLHVHTASGLMHDNFRASTMDYGHLMDCAFRLEKHVEAYRKVFRLAAFNVFSHNRDDHSKNVSFLMNARGAWQLAPAYDLTFSYSSYGFHSTMTAGESQCPGTVHLLKLARHFGLKDGKEIIDEVRSAIANWNTIAKDTGVSSETIHKIQLALNNIEN
ncbi:MAG: type II toxin-antitoxin system HipA family toxin [Bacteroidales bacterium]|nr:type II toxin-antitoxin system HipA family toxin [Bacteroidales bacterium]